MTPAMLPQFPENRVIREGQNPRKVKPKKPSVAERVRPVLISAFFWYALLAIVGAVLASSGVALQFGIGYGAIVLGVFMMAGAEIVRLGMMRG